MTDKEIVIAKIVEEKEEKRNKEEDLIELRTVEEMVPRQFHKYLKVFEKNESKRIPIINLRPLELVKRVNLVLG